MRVYINDYNATCCAGMNIEEIFDAILKKKSGVSYQDNYIDNLSIPLGKIQDDTDFFELIKQNVAKTIKNLPSFNPKEVTLLVGSSVGGMCFAEDAYFKDHNCENITAERLSIRSIADELIDTFGFASATSFSTACTSSSAAIDLAYDMISNDLVKNVIIVGADELSRSAVNGFHALGIASNAPTKPFDSMRQGINVAEGIAVLALSSNKYKGCVEILGCGTSSDAYNITHPHPEGEGAIAAMREALHNAGLQPSDIDYINAHGTGTVANDETEALAISAIFGNQTPTSSTKAITGHTLGACGALEVAISAMCIKHKIIPPSANIDNKLDSDINLILNPIKSDVRYILSNAFGFGGGNVSIVIGSVDED
ncbi:MAG: beta-ketoacyl-[acyl-carrier-protein] synthase family protein [Campylobacterales bacterium]|nr:beta-ketoacyl-[acyl-carrier-protein] synthase family protein [Campylobacterales bacterium]